MRTVHTNRKRNDSLSATASTRVCPTSSRSRCQLGSRRGTLNTVVQTLLGRLPPGGLATGNTPVALLDTDHRLFIGGRRNQAAAIRCCDSLIVSPG
jgi:hypothetical protein